MAEELLIRCTSCRAVLQRSEETKSPDGDIWLEFYTCGDCDRKLMLVWELTGKGMKPEHQTFVETEALRRGAFFPTDIMPNKYRR